METNKKDPLPQEIELFYNDFITSGLLTPELLARLLENASYTEDINTNGASLDILDDDEMVAARIKAESPSSNSGIVVLFAGVEIDVSLEQFKKDVGLDLT